MNMNEKYSVSLPYPSVSKCIEKDVSFASSLNTLRLGELQTISEYIYQSILLEDEYPDIAKALESTAIVEMRHYKILSKLMCELGADPYLNNRIRTLPLNISDKNDKNISCKVKKALTQHISEENSAKEEYLRLANCSRDPEITKILERIAYDEELHSELFDKILHKLTF